MEHLDPRRAVRRSRRCSRAIGNLELVARNVVDGVINGLHRSPYFGASVDFAEHRGYVPGDDIRRVDWKVFARTDRYFVKEFEADSNANFSVLLDVSKSMAFGARHHQARLRQDAGGVPDVSGQQAARPRRAGHLRRGHRRPRAAVGQAPGRGAAHARSRQGGASRPARAAAAQAGRALRPPRHRRRDFGSLRRAAGGDGRARRSSASAATTSSCFTCSIRPRSTSRSIRAASFEDLESGEQMPVVPDALREQYRALVQRAHRGADHARPPSSASTTRC